MLNQDSLSKALFARLEKATAATPPKDLAEGRSQNPFSTIHWLLENSPGGYTFTAMRGGVIASQKMFMRQDLFTTTGEGTKKTTNVNDAAVEAIVKAMFEGVPALAA